ncbi:MAG: arsenosugar biosynthesis radical SAM (seleno)protein ArsS [Pseudomonadota bacterium]
MLPTLPRLTPSDFPPIRRGPLDTLQVNLGYRCNQQCLHCHVNAGPRRTEVMSAETVDEVLRYLAASGVRILDLTGGAPELNPEFRYLVAAAHELGCHVIDRCNLTVLEEPGQEDLAAFLAEQQVEIVASLPCYLEENVDGQRGKGVYEKSVRVLKRLNALGYGREDGNLTLTLVYNPTGPFLPPDEAGLEADYRRELAQRHGIRFNRLFTLANMPIARFGSTLLSRGTFDDYMQTLKNAMQPANLAGVMCRSLISVDWRGYVYDCDFNQMLGLPLNRGGHQRLHLRDLARVNLAGNPIVVADHCYGCTAGQGSSCGGAVDKGVDRCVA